MASTLSSARALAATTIAATNRERLRQALPATIDLLLHRQADRIDTADIDDFVKLNWLEWHGGGLRVTITGRNVCAQLATSPV